jgi:hypothetical protein
MRPAYVFVAAAQSTWVDVVRAVAWPVVALVLVLVVAMSGTLRKWLVTVVRNVRKVSALGVDVELSAKVATEVKEVTAEAFKALRMRVNVEFDRLVHVHHINDQRNRLIESVVRPELIARGSTPQFRSTIYVEDVLFSETMYQLLDYYPKAPGSRGRTIPIRFGIVGRSWRSRRSEIEEDVPTDPQQLIREWGMTWEQASSAGRDRRSFACVLLHDDQQGQVCLVYLDSPEVGAFGVSEWEKTQFVDAITAGAENIGLTKNVAVLLSDLRSRSPFIQIYTDD